MNPSPSFRRSAIDLKGSADRLLCRPAFGIPFFFAVLFIVFHLSFYGIGETLSRFLESGLFRLGENAADALRRCGASDLTVRYLIKGVYTSLASAIAFFPQTVIFFLLIRALNDCGYLSRVVFVTDRFFRMFGLSGRAVVPLLLGYGCAVSSVCICDSESSEGSAVICALPFIPCNARLTVLLFLADSFFPKQKAIFAVSVFALSFILIFLSFLMTSHRKKNPPPPITELPEYRLPNPRMLLEETANTAREYFIRAGTAVGLCSAVFSALAMLMPSLKPTQEFSKSLLYGFAARIAPIFRPLGFDDVSAVCALIFGFFAKENMIGIFPISAPVELSALFSTAGAAAFTVFSMFYTPCASLLFAVAQKSGIREATKLFFHTFTIAYTVSLILYTILHIFWMDC